MRLSCNAAACNAGWDAEWLEWQVRLGWGRQLHQSLLSEVCSVQCAVYYRFVLSVVCIGRRLMDPAWDMLQDPYSKYVGNAWVCVMRKPMSRTLGVVSKICLALPFGSHLDEGGTETERATVFVIAG